MDILGDLLMMVFLLEADDWQSLWNGNSGTLQSDDELPESLPFEQLVLECWWTEMRYFRVDEVNLGFIRTLMPAGGRRASFSVSAGTALSVAPVFMARPLPA